MAESKWCSIFIVGLSEVLSLVVLIWSIILTGFVAWIFLFFKKLSDQIGKDNLINILNKVLDRQKDNTGEIKKLFSEIKRIDSESVNNINRFSIVKFNPFDELGGDHSFSICVLDGNLSGFILTSIHTREKTRVYIKDIFKGKPKVDLSKEEKKALSQVLVN